MQKQNSETVFAVGMKTYDADHKLVRNRYEFIDGPFESKSEAFKAAFSACESCLSTYSCFCDVYLKNSDDSVALVRSDNDAEIHMFDIVPVDMNKAIESPYAFKGKGAKSTDPRIIKLRATRKCSHALAEYRITE